MLIKFYQKSLIHVLVIVLIIFEQRNQIGCKQIIEELVIKEEGYILNNIQDIYDSKQQMLIIQSISYDNFEYNKNHYPALIVTDTIIKDQEFMKFILSVMNDEQYSQIIKIQNKSQKYFYDDYAYQIQNFNQFININQDINDSYNSQMKDLHIYFFVYDSEKDQIISDYSSSVKIQIVSENLPKNDKLFCYKGCSDCNDQIGVCECDYDKFGDACEGQYKSIHRDYDFKFSRSLNTWQSFGFTLEKDKNYKLKIDGLPINGNFHFFSKGSKDRINFPNFVENSIFLEDDSTSLDFKRKDYKNTDFYQGSYDSEDLEITLIFSIFTPIDSEEGKKFEMILTSSTLEEAGWMQVVSIILIILACLCFFLFLANVFNKLRAELQVRNEPQNNANGTESNNGDMMVSRVKITSDTINKYMPMTLYVALKGFKEFREQSECMVCLDDFKEPDECRVTVCFHIFHVTCLDAWIKQHGQCPFCRHDLTKKVLENQKALKEEFCDNQFVKNILDQSVDENFEHPLKLMKEFDFLFKNNHNLKNEGKIDLSKLNQIKKQQKQRQTMQQNSINNNINDNSLSINGSIMPMRYNNNNHHNVDMDDVSYKDSISNIQAPTQFGGNVVNRLQIQQERSSINATEYYIGNDDGNLSNYSGSNNINNANNDNNIINNNQNISNNNNHHYTRNSVSRQSSYQQRRRVQTPVQNVRNSHDSQYIPSQQQQQQNLNLLHVANNKNNNNSNQGQINISGVADNLSPIQTPQKSQQQQQQQFQNLQEQQYVQEESSNNLMDEEADQLESIDSPTKRKKKIDQKDVPKLIVTNLDQIPQEQIQIQPGAQADKIQVLDNQDE